MEPTAEPEIQRVTVKTKEKDPKKVAAGRAAAAARQAKEDKLKADLQEAKLKLVGPSDSQIDPPKSELPEQRTGPPELPARNATDWKPGIIGVVGLAGAVLLYLKPWGSRGKQAPPDKGGLKKEPKPSPKQAPPDKGDQKMEPKLSPQLNDPHYMA